MMRPSLTITQPTAAPGLARPRPCAASASARCIGSGGPPRSFPRGGAGLVRRPAGRWLGRARRLAAVPALGPRLAARRPRRYRLAEVEVVAARLRPLLPLVLRVRPLAAVGPLRRRSEPHERNLRDRHLVVERDRQVGDIRQ